MTNWSLKAQCKGLRPLTVDADGLLCHKRGALYRVSFDLKRISFICNLPVSGFMGHFGNNWRLVDRALRLSPNHGTVIDGVLFISRRSEIWRCDLATGKLSLDFIIPDGRRALAFGRIEHPDGEVEIVFGDYFSNPGRKPARIWGRSTRNPHWLVKGEFAAGEIEHVHAVTAIGERVFVLCGDFDHAAGMWVTDRSFSSISPLLRGNQTYRAAWITELGGRLYYATDTQLERNHTYELCIENGIATNRPLEPIEGSSIYSASGVGRHFFSTTVECGMPTGHFLRDTFDTCRGPGILSSNAKIMSIDANGNSEEIFSAKKDALPFRLAQFGTFTFPTGEMPADLIVAYGIAIHGFDDTCLVFTK